jgi:hypothetical protein
VLLHDGWSEAALPVTTAAPSRRNFYGVPNLSLFLRFFNAMAFLAGFQRARISNFIPEWKAFSRGVALHKQRPEIAGH